MSATSSLDQRGAASRRRFLRLVGLAGVGSLLAACAAPPAPVAKPTEAPKPAAPPAAPAPPAPAPAVPAASPAASPAGSPAPAKPAAPAVDLAPIETAASQEGKVTVYSSFNLDEFDKIYPVFEKRYPGVKVEHIRATGEQLVQRLLTETRGGKVLADVLETNSFDVYNAMQGNLLEAWAPPNAAAFPANLRDGGGVWIASRQNTDVIAYNTNLVKQGEEPKGYDDLAEPRWKGKILMEADDMEMFAGLISGKFEGSTEKASAWLKKLAENKPEFFKGHTETADLLAAGQNAVFLGAYAHRIELMKKKGAPLDWVKSEGAQLLQLGSLIKGAPHPNAAKLFWNWLLGEEAQAAISTVGRIPARPGVKLEAPLLPDGTKWYPARPEMASRYAEITKLWKETFGLR